MWITVICVRAFLISSLKFAPYGFFLYLFWLTKVTDPWWIPDGPVVSVIRWLGRSRVCYHAGRVKFKDVKIGNLVIFRRIWSIGVRILLTAIDNITPEASIASGSHPDLVKSKDIKIETWTVLFDVSIVLPVSMLNNWFSLTKLQKEKENMVNCFF